MFLESLAYIKGPGRVVSTRLPWVGQSQLYRTGHAIDYHWPTRVKRVREPGPNRNGRPRGTAGRGYTWARRGQYPGQKKKRRRRKKKKSKLQQSSLRLESIYVRPHTIYLFIIINHILLVKYTSSIFFLSLSYPSSLIILFYKFHIWRTVRGGYN